MNFDKLWLNILETLSDSHHHCTNLISALVYLLNLDVIYTNLVSVKDKYMQNCFGLLAFALTLNSRPASKLCLI